MDSRSAQIFAEREVGQFPLSIATSLAIEGALGIMKEDDARGVKQDSANPPIKEYQHLWVNLRTLFRNIHGSMKREAADSLDVNALSEMLLIEATTLASVVHARTQRRVSVFFYACTYKSLASFYPHANFKETLTDKQRIYAGFESSSVEALLKLPHELLNIETFNMTISPQGSFEHVAVMTHYPVDLLEMKGVRDIGLLESHTGVIKTKYQWYTKLKNGKELVRIPFDRMTLQLLGDSAGMFSAYPPAFRKKLLEIAEKHQWNQRTTRDRIMLTISLAKDPVFEGTVKKLY